MQTEVFSEPKTADNLSQHAALSAVAAFGQPLISLSSVSRVFGKGENAVAALNGVSFDIHAGEFVAIVGRSGSGKSTLLNVLGCLDEVSGGVYSVENQNVADLNADARATLRRETFGFIFQRYNLLPQLDATANVALAGVYARLSKSDRMARACELLSHLGLGHRLQHLPSKLSGGEQQRVSVARALINRAKVILADEPTGALDRKTGDALMATLHELNSDGYTVILITHDPELAVQAGRTIKLVDGQVSDDSGTALASIAQSHARAIARAQEDKNRAKPSIWRAAIAGCIAAYEAAVMAFTTLWAHKLRSSLTMLGIAVGVASICITLGFGSGYIGYVEQYGFALRAQRIELVDSAAQSPKSQVNSIFGVGDFASLLAEPYVEKVCLKSDSQQNFQNGAAHGGGTVFATKGDCAAFERWELVSGRHFNAVDHAEAAQVVLLSPSVKNKLFKGEDPLGKQVMVGGALLTVIGEFKNKNKWAAFYPTQEVMVPFETAAERLTGDWHSGALRALVRAEENMSLATNLASGLMTARHSKPIKTKDYTEEILRDEEQRAQIMLMLGGIGMVVLFVGGIGVMNIMLVAVKERTREIGIRVATGAREADIRRQFLLESVAVCALGGALGVALAYLAKLWHAQNVDEWGLIINGQSIAIALGFSAVIGILFGYFPARRAARLDPVQALAQE